jgi:hypothetical protein
MAQQSDPDEKLAFSYLELRKAVGIIGIALPFTLAIGKIVLQCCGLQESVSAYYYTEMRNVFVGSMCAIGVFMLSTRGYDWRDKVAGRLASIFAIGLALLPTSPGVTATAHQKCIGIVHLTFSALLFLTLGYMSLWLFTKTVPNVDMTDQKKQRNKVYKVCGIAIFTFVGFIAVVKLWPCKILEPYSPVFWLESGAIEAFGVSWLTKGEAILKDQIKQEGLDVNVK